MNSFFSSRAPGKGPEKRAPSGSRAYDIGERAQEKLSSSVKKNVKNIMENALRGNKTQSHAEYRLIDTGENSPELAVLELDKSVKSAQRKIGTRQFVPSVNENAKKHVEARNAARSRRRTVDEKAQAVHFDEQLRARREKKKAELKERAAARARDKLAHAENMLGKLGHSASGIKTRRKRKASRRKRRRASAKAKRKASRRKGRKAGTRSKR